LTPTVRRTWAPRGQTPVLQHWDRHDRVSAISAISVSPRRQRCNLYMHLYPDNLTHDEVTRFVRDVLRHLRGHVILLWDRASIHRGGAITVLQQRFPRLHVVELPSYAPELNPDEGVWAYAKRDLANGRPPSTHAIMRDLTRVMRTMRRRPALLRACITASDLPPLLH
jgi:transposase